MYVHVGLMPNRIIDQDEYVKPKTMPGWSKVMLFKD
jgi:hypothetical protein